MEIHSITSFLNYYERVRERTNKLVKIIPPHQLDWSYMPGKFSIGDLIRHISSIERNMFAETIAGRQSKYAGCGKNLADGYENVLAYFNQMHEETLIIIGGLTEEDLQRRCLTPGNASLPVWKWLRALTEHEIHHRGQLYLYLNMVGINAPPMFGLTAEQVQAFSEKK